MSSNRIELLLAGWNQNQQTLQRLWQAIPLERLTEQPAGMTNHPAWTLAHLLHYHPAILSLSGGQAVSDPGKHPDAGRYDAGSTPVDDPGAYPKPDQLWQRYQQNHQAITQALRQADDGLLDQPPGLARWQSAFPDTAVALQYLMHYHECTHIGQIMVWRRLLGLSPLE